MKAKLYISVFSVVLLLCGLSAFAQDLNVPGNVNLMSPNYAYQIDGNNVLRVFQTATDGSNLYLGRGAGLNLNGVESQPTRYPNAFLGNFAGRNTQNGVGGNTAVGYAAGSNNILGNYNTYLGYKAGGNYQANPPSGKSGGSNTIVGYQAGYNTTGGDANTFLGMTAGFNNTQGGSNTFLGVGAGYNNTQGGANVFIGMNAGAQHTIGNWNIFIGSSTGSCDVTGDRNIYLGRSNCTGQESYTIRIGDYFDQKAAYIAGIYGATATGGQAVYIDQYGKLGTSNGQEDSQEEVIKAQQQQITDLQQRVARLEALIGKK